MLVLQLIALLHSYQVLAQWVGVEDAPVVLEREAYKLSVHADGSYDGEDKLQFTIQKEAGIEQMMLQHFFYDPNVESISISKASVTDAAGEKLVDPKIIEDKPMASEGPGLRSKHQLSIPMPRMQVGSKIEIILQVKGNKPLVPGYFFFEEKFGQNFVERAHEIEIESELPLNVKGVGTDQAFVVRKETRNGKNFVSISLQGPISRILAGELFPLLTDELLPRVEISSFDNWSKVVEAFGPEMEKEYAKPLPQKFQEIADQALSSKEPKIKMAESVVRSLISKMKYLGDWRLEQNYYLPRPLAEIESSGHGDCKDFAISASAILRKLGINAWVAWVDRGIHNYGLPETKPLLPSYSHFNHAIVQAEIEGKTYWIDPTNPSASVEIPYVDIADRLALVFKSSTLGLASIPPANQTPSKMDFYEYLVFRENGKVDGMSRATLSGSAAVEMDRVMAAMPEKVRPYLLLESSIPGGKPKFIGYPYAKSEAESSSDPSNKRVTYSYELVDLLQQTSLGMALAVPRPKSLLMFRIPANGRTTGIRTGGPFISHRKMVLAHFSVAGAPPKGCVVDTWWAKASRIYSATTGGLVIEDTVEAKRPALSLNEMVSPKFEEFQKQVEDCFNESLLVFKYAQPGPRVAAIHNEILEEKGDIGKAGIEKFNKSTNENGYGDCQFAKMMIHEALAQNLAAAKNWGRLAIITRWMASADPGPTEADYLAESNEQARVAVNLDRSEYNANMVLFTDSLFKGDFHDVERRLAVIKKQAPEAIRKFQLKILSYKIQQGIDVKRNGVKAVNLLIEEIKAATNGDDRSELFESLGNKYLALKQYDYAEISYRRGIEENPKSSWRRLNFSSYLSTRSKFKEAEEFARSSLKVGETGMAHKVLAIALAGQAYDAYNRGSGNDSYKEAIRLCEEALEHDNKNERCPGLVADLKQRISWAASINDGPNPQLAERNRQLEENAFRFPAAMLMRRRPNMNGQQPTGAQPNQPAPGTPPSGGPQVVQPANQVAQPDKK